MENRLMIPPSLQNCIIRNVQLKELLHFGTYSKLVEAEWEGSVVAVELVHAVFEEELEILEFHQRYQLGHNNIVRFFGIYFPPGAIIPGFVMERLVCSLHDLLKRNATISLETKLSILHQTGSGLRYLHSGDPPIILGKLSTKKVLISKAMEAKIVCIGAVIKIKFKTDNQSCDVNFAAPEVIADQMDGIYSKKVDVFSFGSIMFHMFSTKFNVISDPATRMHIVTTWEGIKGHIQHLNKSVDDVIVPLIMNCLKHLPSERPSIIEICEQLQSLLQLVGKEQSTLHQTQLVQKLHHHPWPSLSKQAMHKYRELWTWQQCASLPIKFWATSVAVCDGIVYVATNVTRLYVYKPNIDKWFHSSVLPPVVEYSIVTAPNKKHILAIGGRSYPYVLSNTVYLWDKMNERWITPYPNMPTPRYRCAAISYKSNVIVVGGIKQHISHMLTTAVEVLHVNDTNPHDSYWSVIQHPLPITTYGSIPLIIDDTLYIAAGYNENSVGVQVVLTAYLPHLLQNNNSTPPVWSRLPNVPYCSRSINCYQGYLITFTGDHLVQHMKGAWESVPYIHVYNPDTQCWDRVDEVVPHDYYLGMSVHLTDNKILFIGGLNGTHNPNNVFDIVSNCWILATTTEHPSIIPY